MTRDTPDGQERPDWSPDGTRLVFETQFSQLWTVDVDGSQLTKVFDCELPCHAVQTAAWSPDGKTIAFAVAETKDGKTTWRSAIQALDVDTMSTRTLYQDTSHRVWLLQPRWSPDGTSLVFEEDTYATDQLSEETITGSRLAIVSASGKDKSPTYLATTTSRPGEPDWSRGGDLIVFSAGDNLYTVRADGTSQRQLTNYDADREHAIQPTFTPDGTAIVFTYVRGQFGVDDAPEAAVISVDGTGMSTLVGAAPATHPRMAASSVG